MAKEKKATIKKTSNVKMIEYSIKMVIPTGQYANIQPEIKVTSLNPEEAHDYCAPHMNKLWKEYFMVNDRVVEVTPKSAVNPGSSGTEQKAQVLPASGQQAQVLPASGQQAQVPAIPLVEAPPSSNVAVIKATNAIKSCTSLEALDLIKNQVELSVKLDKGEKPQLRVMIVEKFNELSADAFAKKNGL